MQSYIKNELTDYNESCSGLQIKSVWKNKDHLVLKYFNGKDYICLLIIR